MCGFSPITTILTYELLRPRRLVVITSEDADESINVIGERVIGPDRLKHKDFSPRMCMPTDTLGIYRIVSEELSEHARRIGSRSITYIDITGGRKVMSAAAALAAWQLNLGICYVESDTEEHSKRHIPVSLRLLLDRQHHGIHRRIEIEPDHIDHLLLKIRVGRQLERPLAMRLKIMLTPQRDHEVIATQRFPSPA